MKILNKKIKERIRDNIVNLYDYYYLIKGKSGYGRNCQQNAQSLLNHLKDMNKGSSVFEIIRDDFVEVHHKKETDKGIKVFISDPLSQKIDRALLGKE